jgi:hypothetical protein
VSDEKDKSTAKHVALEGPDTWDRVASVIGEHGAVPALAILTIAMGIIYGGIFRGEVAGDDLTFHMAESRRLADCLAAGDWDFWNPSANGGYASAYYYQVLPQLASALPAAIFGHHTFFFQLSVFLPLVLAPAAAYRGMRLMGCVPWQAVTAAFVLAFTIGQSRWGFSADGTFSVGLYTQTWSLAAFPLALGYCIHWLRDGTKLAPAIAWGAFVGLCHPFGGISLALSLALGVTAGFVLDIIKKRPVLDSLRAEPLRIVILGIGLAVATMPGWITMLVDAKGFGGFPHRVDDEVGPGFAKLALWHWNGLILDHGRVTVLTWALPVALALGRGKQLRWLWVPGIAFAVLLGLGPNMPKTADDLIPAVRFLGAMQIMFALAIGSACYSMGLYLWNAKEDGLIIRSLRAALSLTGSWALKQPIQYGLRTGVAAVAAALIVLMAVPGARVESSRVHVLAAQSNNQREQMVEMSKALEAAPQGRKQAGPGAENHWWNLTSYVWGRTPSLLQMGGGGLQASPNYDFLWSVRDYTKNAWIYDAPYIQFSKDRAATMPVGDVVIETAGYIVRRLPSPGLVSPIQITGILPEGPIKANSDARKAAIAWMRTDMPMKNRHLVYPGFGLPGTAPMGTVLRSWRQDSPGDEADIVAEVDATALTTIMARESWHPRWHAYVDGIDTPVRRVTPDFVAVDVPQGRHIVQFRFERPWWANASYLAWPLAAFAAFIPVLWRRRKERKRIPQARIANS